MEIIYYTCNTHLPEIDELCRKHLGRINLPIISVSLNKDIGFGNVRLRMEGERSPLTMHRQIVKGLEHSISKNVFLCESDVLYHPSHFEYTPERDDKYYFNVNVWKLRWKDGFCTRTDNSQQISGIVANRELLLGFYSGRVAEIEKDGFNRHYEPPEDTRINYSSEVPNICIRHDNNITMSKWSIDDYRNKKYAIGWKEANIKDIPYWGKIWDSK